MTTIAFKNFIFNSSRWGFTFFASSSKRWEKSRRL